MRINALLLVTLFVAAACTQVDWVRPQHVFEATATARAQLAELPPLPDVAPAVVPDATAMAIEVEEEGQADCDIAGNISASGEKIYHLPTGVYYSRIRIDLEAGEAWFCSEGQAVEAGFRRSLR